MDFWFYSREKVPTGCWMPNQSRLRSRKSLERWQARSKELGKIWMPLEAPSGASPVQLRTHFGRFLGVPRWIDHGPKLSVKVWKKNMKITRQNRLIANFDTKGTDISSSNDLLAHCTFDRGPSQYQRHRFQERSPSMGLNRSLPPTDGLFTELNFV